MKQYSPVVQVLYRGLLSGSDMADITHWFGDSCTIRTSKGIFEPYGTWSITFLDKRMGGSSVYANLSPMDAIEIKVAHDGRQAPKTIMRGFVSSVTRSEALGGDGKPVRRVTVSGQDVGKLWTTLSLFLNPMADPKDSQRIMTRLGPISKFLGEEVKNMTGVELLTKFTKMMDEDLQQMLAGQSMDMTLEARGEGEGDCSAGLLQSMTDITYYQFLQHCLDGGAMNELWIDDPGEGAALVRWRELWTGEEGNFYDEDQIQSLSVSRDDSRVSNWFWYWPRVAAFLDMKDVQNESRLVGEEAQSALDHYWSAQKFFGFRKLEVQSAMLPPSWATHADEKSKEANIEGRMPFTEWVKKQTEKLKNMNKDNVRLENCTCRMLGDETARAGQWHTISKSGVAFRYYAVKIEHEINLWGGYFTTLHGMRGEKWSGQGTYLAELNLSGAVQ